MASKLTRSHSYRSGKAPPSVSPKLTPKITPKLSPKMSTKSEKASLGAMGGAMSDGLGSISWHRNKITPKMSPKSVKASLGAMGGAMSDGLGSISWHRNTSRAPTSTSSHTRSSHTRSSLRGSIKWDEKTKADAIDSIHLVIVEQKKKEYEMESAMEHLTDLIAARLETENDIGAILSMKQILKYEAIREQATRNAEALEDLKSNVKNSTSSIPYKESIQQILAVTPPTCNLTDDRTQLLAQARKRLSPITQTDRPHQSRSVAA